MPSFLNTEVLYPTKATGVNTPPRRPRSFSALLDLCTHSAGNRATRSLYSSPGLFANAANSVATFALCLAIAHHYSVEQNRAVSSDPGRPSPDYRTRGSPFPNLSHG